MGSEMCIRDRLLGGGLFIAVWLAFVLEKVDIQLTEIQRTIVLIVSIVEPIKSPR